MSRLAAVAVLALLAAACGDDDLAPALDSPAPIEFGASGAADDDAGSTGGDTASDSAPAPEAGDQLQFEGRADINRTGNRVSTGVGDLDGPAIEVEVGEAPRWIVPSASEAGAPWVVNTVDGRLLWVDPIAGSVEVLDDDWGDAEPVVRGTEGIEPWGLAERFPNALADGRLVTDGAIGVFLADPTDRYGHAVLGDDIEAGGFVVTAVVDGSSRATVTLDDDVIEGRTALLGDVDGDGDNEILVTQSNDSAGARLVLYDRDGEQLAESEPIGRGNRWRNQLAIAPLGPNGEIEIVDVRTPHLGRTIEWFRVDGDELVRVAQLDGYTNHVIGSRNLDLGIVADANGDGRLDVVVPTSDRRALHAVTRVGGGAEVVVIVELGARMTSNVGAVDHPDGGATYAAGTEDGLVRFWVS